ncbi:MAG: fused MFS/spermidine synthase [Proteobacteria bacterium]|nr:fused MFS/spermidine synthase [Pseudomonadota bacterium]
MLQFALAFVVFVSSAGGMVMEIVAGRLIAPYVGMSLYTWTAIIAVVLSGLSAGHWVGGHLAPLEANLRTGSRRIAVALALAGISSLASLVLLRVVSGKVLASGIGTIPAIVLLSGTLFFLPSLFVGIVSPIVTKLAIDVGPLGPGRIIGRMFALGALGSILGTLLAGYLFISWIGSTGTVLVVAGVYALLALGFVIGLRSGALLSVFMVLGIFGGGLVWWGKTEKAFQSPCQTESDYFCIRIVDISADNRRQSAMMVLDHLVHGINDAKDPGFLYSPYIHFIDEITKFRLPQGQDPSAFFIGGGGYSLPRAWGNDYEAAKLVVAEIDPGVTQAAREHLWLSAKTPGLSIMHQDARAALQSLPAEPSFDVVFGDAFRDITIPTHLVTREFHRQIAGRLKPAGFYVVNVVDDAESPRFLYSLIRTLNADFKAVEVWRTLGEMSETGRVTYVVLASQAPTSASRINSSRGIARTWARWPDADIRPLITAEKVPELTDDFAPVDWLMAGLIFSAKD